jgi:hypothetical protein
MPPQLPLAERCSFDLAPDRALGASAALTDSANGAEQIYHLAVAVVGGDELTAYLRLTAMPTITVAPSSPINCFALTCADHHAGVAEASSSTPHTDNFDRLTSLCRPRLAKNSTSAMTMVR